MSGRVVKVGSREIELSNLDKMLFPGDGLTKGDLVDYAERIAGTALPHLAGRPVSLERYPDGIGEGGFFQKDAPDYFPDWIARADLPKEGGRVGYTLVEEAATLVYLAGQGCVTLHAGLSRVDRPDRPDRLIFDLDPSDGDFAKVQGAAAVLRELLDGLEAASFVQTTGSRGLHVVAPLDRSAGFDEARALARRIAERAAAANPDRLTVEQRKAKRGDRVFIDYLRNAYGQTVVAPYSVRARPGAPVATPLDWDEALAKGLGPRDYRIDNIFRRLAQKSDPWARIDLAPAAVAALAARLGEGWD